MSYELRGLGLGTDGDSASTSNASEQETLFEQGWEWFREIAGAKDDQPVQQPAPMPGATPDGKPTASGFSSYAREAAIRETAAIDEEQAPIEETPPDDPETRQNDERSWIERYQTHITLASTVIGLGTFVIWLMLRKKSSGEEY